MVEHGMSEEEASALAMRVRSMCQMYGDSAENVGMEIPADEELFAYEKARYERARTDTIEMAISLSEPFYRDIALHSVLEMCMKAHDLQFSEAIAKAIITEQIQERVVEEFPNYFAFDDRGRLRLA
jgi:hypothetical protein